MSHRSGNARLRGGPPRERLLRAGRLGPLGGQASLSATGGSTNLTLSGVSGTFAPGEELLLHQSQAAPQAAGRIGVLAPAGVTGATSPAYDPE